MVKKILLIVVAFLAFLNSNAQIESQAIGLRFGGGNWGSGAEVNYMNLIGDANRVEFGLGINAFNGNSYTNIVGVYQWVWDLGENFFWYAGPGAQFIFNTNSSSMLLGGEVGVEYNFNTELELPLQIGFDTRPMINLGSGSRLGWGVALKVHYTF